MRKQRIRRNLQLFSCGFIVSILFVILILGLLYVNYHARQTGWVDDKTLVETYNSGDVYTLRIVNFECTLDWGAIRERRPLLQKLTVFIPVSIRAVAAGFNGMARLLSETLSTHNIYEISP